MIVKLLGRKIGFKTLEARIHQMWVKKWVINMIDVGNDYFLITFTNMEDHKKALTKGPWLIFDHYLRVREWTPNFDPTKTYISTVAIWVRVSGLPIEYYDAKFLTILGNRIGRTGCMCKLIFLNHYWQCLRLTTSLIR